MKNFYTITLAIFISQIVFTQTAPEIAWEETINAPKLDQLSFCIPTNDDGFFAGGTSLSGIGGDKTETGFEDGFGGFSSSFWVLKTDNAGNINWQNTIGGMYSDYITDGKQTSDGGYILAGVSQSPISGDKTEDAIEGNYDFWIVKISALGEVEWDQTIGGPGYESRPVKVCVTSDGGYIIAGTSRSELGYDKTENSENDDFWVLRLNETGEILWQNTIGGNLEESVSAIYQTDDGGYILGGSSKSNASGDKSEDNFDLTTTTFDYWVIKLDDSGDVMWEQTYGGNNNDYLTEIIPLPEGGYIVSGTSRSGVSGVKTIPLTGIDEESDTWILKLNDEGNIAWQIALGGNHGESGKIALTNEGGYIVACNSNSNSSGNKSENSKGLSDYWIVKLDIDGNVQWDKTIGGNKDDFPVSVYQNALGEFIIGGDSRSNISGDKSELCMGYVDYWIVKLFPEENPPCSTAPTSLYADFISSATAKLHWSADPDAIKYKVQFRKNTEVVWTNTNASSNVKNLFSLEPSTTYKFRIKSLCGPGLTSDWSAVGTFTTTPLKAGEFISENIEIHIYPNPNSGIFHLEIEGLKTEENISMRVFNLLGEEIYAETISNTELISQTIKLNSTIENGLYFIEIKAGEKIYTEQIIISK